MGLESTSNIAGLVATNPVGGTDPKSQGDDHLRLIKAVLQATFPGLSGPFNHFQSKGSAFTVVAADNLSFFLVGSSGSPYAITLTAAATLGNGFSCVFKTSGTNALIIVPNGAELINGVSSLTLSPGDTCFLYCTGAAFHSVVVPGAFVPTTYDNDQSQASTAATVVGSSSTVLQSLSTTLAAGDRLIVTGFAQLTKGGTGGATTLGVSRSAGSGVFYDGSTQAYATDLEQLAATTRTLATSAIFKAASATSITLDLVASSAGSNATNVSNELALISLRT